MTFVSAIEFLIVLLLCIEVFDDEADEVVLVIRYIHHIEVFTEEFLHELHRRFLVFRFLIRDTDIRD